MKKIREIYERYERKLSAGSIIFGFNFDSLTLIRIDLFLNQVLMIVYLVIAGAGIFLINLKEEGRAKFLEGELYPWLFIAMQFSFGGLFGRYLLYYFHSGTVGTSWPFLLALLLLLVANEFAKKHYVRILLQINFFFLALFLYMIFFVPVLFGRIGTGMFIVSGIVSLVITAAFVYSLLRLFPERIRIHWRAIGASIAGIFVGMNGLYFFNLIPPIPLSLRKIGVYRSVVRKGESYFATQEKERSRFLRTEVVHAKPGDPVYIYSAVFAPTDFGGLIAHVWESHDEEKRQWVLSDEIRFPIAGGQDHGYRGYTYKTNPAPGLWRVRVETLRGQVVGQTKFRIKRVEEGVALEPVTL